MKKSLIALAVLAASGAAFAQSSVTLYGVADLWVGKVNKGKFQAGDAGLAPSRLGFKGTEDLGGGLKAGFQFEQGLTLSDGATDVPTFQRQANLSLSGGFGTIKLGRSTTALDDVYGAANSGFDSALSVSEVWQNGHTGRANAQLYYATPEFAGFTAAVSTQLKGNAPVDQLTTFNVAYANGPIAAAVGYEDDAAGKKGTMFNGSYDLGMAKLMASYYTTKPNVGVRTNSYQLGADVPLSSALTLSVGYANSKVKGGVSDSGFGVAAGYSLSKRTTVYGGFRAASVKSGADKDLIAVGINHTF
ncbi:MAG: porin [Hydrogenophaga sp.]|uniref:porin n=1 Tax=Hydrogenophaga sp. TaxID=1904254 RepID=UPI002742D039|nr:porin [Hydrogenophaga sp.]MDP2417746.1 porin [Hydrogenophaga sp.]MDZ4188493.1 porin [Hydrogenophaga sp.]